MGGFGVAGAAGKEDLVASEHVGPGEVLLLTRLITDTDDAVFEQVGVYLAAQFCW